MRIPIFSVLAATFVFCAIAFSAESQPDSVVEKSVKKVTEVPCGCDGNRATEICPLSDIMSLADGDLFICNYYPTGCADTPDVAYYVLDPNTPTGDCPTGPCIEPTRGGTKNCPGVDQVCSLTAAWKIGTKFPFNERFVEEDGKHRSFISFTPPSKSSEITCAVFCLELTDHYHPGSPKRNIKIGVQVELSSKEDKDKEHGVKVTSPLNPIYKYTDGVYTTNFGHETVFLFCTK